METIFEKFSGRIYLVTMIFALLSLLIMVTSILASLPVEDVGGRNQTLQRVPVIQKPHQSWSGLQTQITGRMQELIKPLQGIAAVKDDGVAAKMAARLQLQGIVNMGGQFVAYVNVDKGSVVALRTGSTVLEFSVLKVEEKTITLSREGVQIVLP